MMESPINNLVEIVEIDRRQFFRIAGGALIALTGLSVVGCGGSGDGSSPKGLGTVSGSVQLPAGFTLPATSLSAGNGMGQRKLGAKNSFSVQADMTGPTLVAILSANGDGVLMGFVDPSKKANMIGAKSTAVALLYFAFGASALPSQIKAKVIEYLDGQAAVATCAKAIGARIAANPTAVSDGDPQVIAAVKTAFEALGGSKITSRPKNAANRGQVTPADDPGLLKISPTGTVFGSEVLQGPQTGTITVSNHFHRPSRAYAYKTGHVDMSTPPVTTTLPAAQLVGTPIDLTDTGGFGVLTLVSDIFKHTAPLIPVVSSPMLLPVGTNDSKTLYSLVVISASNVGSVPSFFADSHYSGEIADWTSHHDFLNAYTFVVDISLGVIFDMFGIKDFIENAASLSAAVTAFETIQDVAWQQIITSVKFGAFGPALKDALTAITSNGYVSQQVRNALAPLIPLVQQRVAFLNPAASATAVFTAITKLILSSVSLVLGLGDLTATLLDLSSSDYGEIWEIVATRPLLHLSPTTVTVTAGGATPQAFTVSAPTGQTGPFVWDWKLIGPSDAQITDSSGQSGQSFETNQKTIFLLTTPVDTGTMQITVEGFKTGSGGTKTSIGTAQADIILRSSNGGTTFAPGTSVLAFAVEPNVTFDQLATVAAFYTFKPLTNVPSTTLYSISSATFGGGLPGIFRQTEIGHGGTAISPGLPFSVEQGAADRYPNGAFNMGSGLVGFFVGLVQYSLTGHAHSGVFATLGEAQTALQAKFYADAVVTANPG